MINTPVKAQHIYGCREPEGETHKILSAEGIDIFCDEDNTEEAAKRINMHDDLVKSLQFLTGIVGGNFCQDMVIKRKYKEARELLEKCK